MICTLFSYFPQLFVRPEKLNEDTRKSCQQQIKKLRAELKYLLAKPILAMTESLRYPRFEACQSYIKQISLNKN